MAEFVKQPKIPRLNRPIVITEKIDGTNAGVLVHDNGVVQACSKNRVLHLGQPDNFGFRAWVDEHASELRKLGPGLHRGEWWGQGIQRGYGLDHKRFSLFAVHRWFDEDGLMSNVSVGSKGTLCPPCCHVVPVLAECNVFDSVGINRLAEWLRDIGSIAAPGFENPEGIVIYHTAAGQLFKVTLENDESPKGK